MKHSFVLGLLSFWGVLLLLLEDLCVKTIFTKLNVHYYKNDSFKNEAEPQNYVTEVCFATRRWCLQWSVLMPLNVNSLRWFPGCWLMSMRFGRMCVDKCCTFRELEGENYLLSGALTTFALPALISGLVIATDQ